VFSTAAETHPASSQCSTAVVFLSKHLITGLCLGFIKSNSTLAEKTFLSPEASTSGMFMLKPTADELLGPGPTDRALFASYYDSRQLGTTYDKQPQGGTSGTISAASGILSLLSA